MKVFLGSHFFPSDPTTFRKLFPCRFALRKLLLVPGSWGKLFSYFFAKTRRDNRNEFLTAFLLAHAGVSGSARRSSGSRLVTSYFFFSCSVSRRECNGTAILLYKRERPPRIFNHEYACEPKRSSPALLLLPDRWFFFIAKRSEKPIGISTFLRG